VYVALIETDQRLAERTGRGRSAASSAVGARNKQLDWRRSNVEIHIDGVIGEIAFCRYYGLFFDERVTPGGGRRPDVVDQYGNRIDVKAARRPHDRLMLYLPKPGENNYENIDIFVLTRLHRYPPFVEIVGWAYKTDLMRAENLQDVGYGPTYFLNENDPRFHKMIP